MAKMEEKEWTLMFYFASDNPLGPEIVSQLKSIKQAGFHPDANVIAHFDPSPENAEPHIFDINRINKLQAGDDKPSRIGFIGDKPDDPYVVNLMTDKLWDDKKEAPIRDQVIKHLKESLVKKKVFAAVEDIKFDPPVPPPVVAERESAASDKLQNQRPVTKAVFETSKELTPEVSLRNFLTFCSDNYPAKHYMLFILGHGLVVGNDTFLFDEHAPEHFLHLRTLREVLDDFRKAIKLTNPKSEFELISFHSCSMSSVEVAFELRTIANYMLASQAPSFVGSWPYRQILIRIFNYLEKKRKKEKEIDIKGLLKRIFHYCQYNAIDFLVAGYSCDGCLCDLTKVGSLEEPISNLSAKLIAGLQAGNPKTQELVRERILLAHLDAQSYFNENYTDQFDFCFRLQRRIELETQRPLPAELQDISDACQTVMEVLKKGVEGRDDGLIVRSEFVGPAYQYSHGLSVYFPWFKPVKSDFWPEEYQEYKFFTDLKAQGKTPWSAFLETYFVETRRRTRLGEFAEVEASLHTEALNSEASHDEIKEKLAAFENEKRPTGRVHLLQEQLLEAFATATFNDDGQLNKPDPRSSTGADCDCQSIKNYPPFTREPQPSGVKSGKNGKNGKIPIGANIVDEVQTFAPDAELTFVLDNLIS